MSSALAIAAVTAMLKKLLDDSVTSSSIDVIGKDLKVTALSPDKIDLKESDPNLLNLFLYQVTPNAALRNINLPSRDTTGAKISNQPLALDLHYLLTAYSNHDYHAEILLGYGMQVFHENPGFGRENIRKMFPEESPLWGMVDASDLADQMEQIKICHQIMSIEEMSKLWAALQAPYRPTAVYQVSVVIIESTHPTRLPLPVLTRGDRDSVTGVEKGISSQTSLIPPYPTLEKVVPQNKQLSIRMGEVLTLIGHHLDGDNITIRFKHLLSSQPLDLQTISPGSSTELNVKLPSTSDGWRAGLYSVTAIIRRTGEDDRVTNELPIALSPNIESINTTPSGNKITFAVMCNPAIWANQQVSLFVGNREIRVKSPTKKVSSLSFEAPASSWQSRSKQWVRLRVDGIESILVNRSVKPPAFDYSQQVTIP